MKTSDFPIETSAEKVSKINLIFNFYI